MAENQRIDIPEVGIVEFPSTMSDADIARAASRLHLKAMNEKPLTVPSTFDEGVQAWWQQHPKTRQLAKGTLDTLPAMGAMVGGVLATPETLGGGTVAGAALGAGAGRGARDLIAEHLGIESPTSPLSKGSRIALDTAITAAVPAVANTAKRLLTDPKTTFADLIETVFHPQGTADKVVDYLRTSARPISTAAAPWSAPNSAEPFKLADGSWGYRSIASGEPLAPGTVANVVTKAGKTFAATVPAPIDPAADIRAAKMLVESGFSPSAAAMKASEGNAARFSKIMSAFMSGGGK